MKKTIKKLATVMAFLAVVAAFSSCNRGYGCPDNFSMEEAPVLTVKAAEAVLEAIIK